MKSDRHHSDRLLGDATTAIGREAAPAEVVDAAARRVWERLAATETAAAAAAPATAATTAAATPAETAPLRGCADVQALFPALGRGELSAARALLVEDHARSCIPCRRALRELRAGAAPAATGGADRLPAVPESWRRGVRYAAAAGLVAVLAWGGWALLGGGLAAGRTLAHVQAVDGALFLVGDEGAAPLAPGEPVRAAQVLRTAKGAGAVVRLADGSLVEMGERSEISLAARRTGNTIHLGRGNIIVQAAPQRARRLFVATGDCLVSVTGTIFSVNRGTKGSRVAVLEGEVRVARGRETSLLHPGEQVATHRSLANVPLADEVAWSRDSARYLELVRELQLLGQEIQRAVALPGLRHSTGLLDLVPPATTVYAALPNVSASLADAHALLLARVAESEVLAAWWRQRMGEEGEARLGEVIERLRAFGAHLGDELVLAVAAAPGETHRDGPPPLLALAEIARPSGFDAVLAAELERLAAAGADAPRLRLVADPATAAPAAGGELLVWLDGDLFAASPSLTLLRELEAVRGGGANAFVGGPFHARLAEVYAEGAGWLLAAELHELLGQALAQEEGDRPGLDRLGLLDARFVVLERREDGELTENRAVLSFDGPRRGVASWLAAPAAMGTLDFVSPEANLAAAFVVKTPAAMLEELFAFVETTDGGFRAELEAFEQREGIDLEADLAAPLGGELAFAIDGPVLPVPSWKLVLEVYDPARLQATIERLVERLNTHDAEAAVRLESEAAGGRRFYTFTSLRSGLTVHYVFVDGYLVAAPSRALLERAIQLRDGGSNLTGAESFVALLPRDGETNFSALVYQHLGPALQPMLGLLRGGGQDLDADERRSLEALVAETPATLAYAYGEEDRIVAASRGAGSLGFNLGTLLGLSGALGGGATGP